MKKKIKAYFETSMGSIIPFSYVTFVSMGTQVRVWFPEKEYYAFSESEKDGLAFVKVYKAWLDAKEIEA
jgi:hypothetical protein